MVFSHLRCKMARIGSPSRVDHGRTTRPSPKYKHLLYTMLT